MSRLHLTFCRHANVSDSELREMARFLERGWGGHWGDRYRSDGVRIETYIPYSIEACTREADLVIDALRRMTG